MSNFVEFTAYDSFGIFPEYDHTYKITINLNQIRKFIKSFAYDPKAENCSTEICIVTMIGEEKDLYLHVTYDELKKKVIGE